MDERESYTTMFATAVNASKPVVLWGALAVLSAFFLATLHWVMEDNPDAKVVWAVMVLALVAAILVMYYLGWMTWASERQIRIRAEQKVKADEPEFVGGIDLVSIWPIGNGFCRMLNYVNVFNAGAPSAAFHWRIRLIVGTQEIEVTKASPLQTDLIEIPNNDEQMARLKGSSFITYKTGQVVERGHFKRGALMCDIPENLPLDWRFVVSFRDIKGKNYDIPCRPSDIKERPHTLSSVGGWPDIDIEFVKP